MSHRQVEIRAERDVWVAIAIGSNMARQLGFNPTDCARVETAISELAQNIWVHAQGGSISFSDISQNGRQGIRVCAVDQGPGISNISQAMRDGFSTRNSLGIGMGIAQRMMDDWSVRSHPGWGTTIVAVKWNKR